MGKTLAFLLIWVALEDSVKSDVEVNNNVDSKHVMDWPYDSIAKDRPRCTCYADCQSFGDCCCNCQFFRPHIADGASCVLLPDSKTYIMISKCPADHAVSKKFISPVTLKQGDHFITYKNKNCASNHGKTLRVKHYSWTKETKNDLPVIKPPAELVGKIRTCQKQRYIDKCPENTKQSAKLLCETNVHNFISVQDHEHSIINVYKNQACLMCNGRTLGQVICGSNKTFEWARKEGQEIRTSTEPTSKKDDNGLSIIVLPLTQMGLTVSIFFLLLHLCAVILVPNMHNLGGVTLAFLCFALLGAYVFLMIGCILVQNSKYKDSWFYIAVLTYYFCMATFFWMSVISYDILRIVMASLRCVREDTGVQWKRLLKFSVTAWVSPLLLTSIAVIIDRKYVKDTISAYRPRFGEINCWSANQDFILVFFLVPLAVITTFNLICYISVVAITLVIENEVSPERRFWTNRDNRYRRIFEKIRFYVRLFVLMGLPWVVGLIALHAGSDVTRSFFTVINTYSGFFIFLSYTTGSKFRNGLSERFPLLKILLRVPRLRLSIPIPLPTHSRSVRNSTIYLISFNDLPDIPDPLRVLSQRL